MSQASNLFSEHLTEDDIAEMMAEAARVDALFQSGRISTAYLVPFEHVLAAAPERAAVAHEAPASLASDAAL